MGELKQIAQAMKAKLADVETGWVQRSLFGGLMIVLERKGRLRRLALGRTKAPPSKTETAVCEEAFRCPPGVEWSWRVTRKKIKSQTITYQVAECTWLED